MKTIDQEFHFKGFGNCDSRCRIRIYEVATTPINQIVESTVDPQHPNAAQVALITQKGGDLQKLHRGDKVVILTQLEGENVGTSVTNASEIIANAVVGSFQDHGLSPFDLFRTIWIEHYNYDGHTETFDRVTYSPRTFIISGLPSIEFRSARWNHLTRDIVASLIGEEP